MSGGDNCEHVRRCQPGTIAWAAERIVRMHVELATDERESGHCEQCREDGRCELLAWARLTLAAPPRARGV